MKDVYAEAEWFICFDFWGYMLGKWDHSTIYRAYITSLLQRMKN